MCQNLLYNNDVHFYVRIWIDLLIKSQRCKHYLRFKIVKVIDLRGNLQVV